MISYNRLYKNIARSAILNGLGERHSVLTLPSSEALCVAELLANRTIRPATPQVWVERKRHLRSAMAQRRQEMHLMNTEIVIDELETATLDRAFDLVNADLQCFMTDRLALWIERVMAPNLLPQASAIFWLMRAFRNNNFINWCIKYFYYGPLHEQVTIFKSRVGTFDPRIVVPRLLIACALRDFDFEWARSIEYADTINAMIVVRIDNICRHRRAPVWPRISDLLQEFAREFDAAYQTRGPSNLELITLHDTLDRMGLSCRYEYDSWLVTVQTTGKTVTEFPRFNTLFETFVGQKQ